MSSLPNPCHTCHENRSDIEFPIRVFTPQNLTSNCLGFWIYLWSESEPMIAKNCIHGNPFWMKENFDHLSDRSIKDIMIPGSHNAGSYEIGYRPDARSLMKKYVMCHDESVFNQLAYGIRSVKCPLIILIQFLNCSKVYLLLVHCI